MTNPNSEQRIEELEVQLQTMEQALLQAQKLSSVGAIASSITHEFNNILMTVINYAKMGIRHKDEATRDKAFDRILQASQRAAKITTGMLAYARGGSDRKDQFDLAQAAEDVLVLLEKDLQKHRINWRFEADDRPNIIGNASQIQQVLMNLVINARQAMGDGGRLLVMVRENHEQHAAELVVRDWGCGMHDDQVANIFQPFYTTKTVDEEGQGGTGLGLSMCKQVVEQHEGRIRVDSTPGEGTTFTLRFPLVGQPAELVA